MASPKETVVLIEPRQPTALDGHPELVLSPSDYTLMPVSFHYLLDGQLDEAKFMSSLSDALSFYPPICGIFRRPSVLSRGAMTILLANRPIPVRLTSRFSGFNQADAKEYVDEINAMRISTGDKNEPLFKVKVTRFTSEPDQWALGISMCHGVADGAGIFEFLQTWSKLYVDSKAHVLAPTHVRYPQEAPESIATPYPSQLPPCEYPGGTAHARMASTLWEKIQGYSPLIWHIIWNDIDHVQVYFPIEAAKILKRKLTTGLSHISSPSEYLSTQDCLKAYIVHALNRHIFTSAEEMMLNVATILDVRGHCGLPKVGYFGNAIGCVSTKEEKNLAMPMLARSIRRSILHHEPAEVISQMKWTLDVQRAGKIMDLMPWFHSNTLYVDDWTKFPIYQIDFGLKVNSFTHLLDGRSLPVKNWVMIYPLEKKGIRVGYTVTVSMSRAYAKRFQDVVANDVTTDFRDYQ
ncbi:hypothetical protein K493DRAFT_306997 [Basidiobolus meristosporus CBS 931.73]|uniref:Transferase n=1 Tax=Basidiobolus meristosporus CBS 931.73 TaxID=1314790 RepID=A0A1Y1XM79_9FUNG|nr:hypothetical protein K493DRAFT_306997 [Basidiobolus meristosporus CBS 931.73]|eukprot:ORX86870.1 hypothetical protein K493DRAFT_306997 [Basidiobolus meristosporus CBS 931.73]